MGKKGPLWWRESDWLLRGSSAANQILLRHSGPILSLECLSVQKLNRTFEIWYLFLGYKSSVQQQRHFVLKSFSQEQYIFYIRPGLENKNEILMIVREFFEAQMVCLHQEAKNVVWSPRERAGSPGRGVLGLPTTAPTLPSTTDLSSRDLVTCDTVLKPPAARDESTALLSVAGLQIGGKQVEPIDLITARFCTTRGWSSDRAVREGDHDPAGG